MTVQGNILVAGTILAAPFIGSFIGTLVEDLPRGRLFARGRSRCDACAATLGPGDLVPLASFLLRRGRCVHCGAAIPRRLLLIELAALLLAIGIAALDPAGPRVPLDFAFAATLLAVALIDLDCLRLPDALTLPLLLAGLLATALRQPAALGAHAAGAALGYLGFTGLRLLWRLLRGIDALGRGMRNCSPPAGPGCRRPPCPGRW
ncbi:unnamed protein product [Acidocella sp. C78]|uniref:prepilin peptidase n=1 Tax=Acidocella sp. C78 TaxID=1671486 RepID=UPI001BB9FD32|nr:prepilin peptidase [Acidocella sp. C78]CAG4914527.1 unnamed protein product [Acidocella sp. C78]